MTRSLVLTLLLGLLCLAPSTAHPAEAFIEAHSIQLLKARGLVAATFELYYGLFFHTSNDPLCVGFPATSFGGTFARCEAYSPAGVEVNFEQAVSWDGVKVRNPQPLPVVAEPEEVVQATTTGTLVPFVGDRVTFTDGTLDLMQLPILNRYLSDSLVFDPDLETAIEVPWSASVCVEIRAIYEDEQGAVVGTLLSSEMGEEPHCAQVDYLELFTAVPLAPTTWGSVKGRY